MTPGIVLLPHVEQALRASASQTLQASYSEPFLEAARQVLHQELRSGVETGNLTVVDGSCTTSDITVIVGITGKLNGVAFYGMSVETGTDIVGRMLGTSIRELDDVALSGIAELGNVITGRAATLLSERGLEVDIAPPVLLVGAGTRVSMSGIQRVVVPLITTLGTLETQLAIKGV